MPYKELGLKFEMTSPALKVLTITLVYEHGLNPLGVYLQNF